MQILDFPSRKLNKKKIIVLILIFSIILLMIVLGIIYALNSSFRAFIDIYLFRKEIKSNNLSYIEVNSDEDQYFHAYDKYIAILNKNILSIYNSSGEVVEENNINISSPLFSSNNKFLAVAEKNGKNLYSVSGNKISWQTSVDGNISKININKNGYTSIIISGTRYNKSIVILFDSKGNELFRTYLSTNIAIDTDVSNDNKYLSIAEIDYSGSIIKSMVKNISIEKAKSDPTNSVVYTYNFKENSLLTDIKYQDKNNLICMCNDSIYTFNVSDYTDNKLLDYENFEFADINLKNNLVYISNKSFGFTNTAYVNIFNVYNNSVNTYEFKGSIKSVYTNNDKLAINTGSEIHFLGLNGWLIKKYHSYNEINNIILGNSIAGIIYKNRIELIEI